MSPLIAGPDRASKVAVRIRRIVLHPAVLAIAASVACAVLFGQVSADQELASLAREARTTASLHAAVLETNIERIQTLPFAISQDETVHAVLRRRDRQAAHALDLKLEALAQEVGPGVLYVLDRDAYGVSMSNWRAARAFCRDPARYCSRREYFLGAMASGRAAMFALGRADQRPGLYLSRAVDEGGQRLGVAVAKVSFEVLEARWRDVGAPTFVSDSNGVVLLSSVPQWRLRTLGALPPAVQASLLASTQFGLKPLRPLPYRTQIDRRPAFALVKAATADGRQSRTYVEVRVPVRGTDWTLHTLRPVGQALNLARGLAAAITLLLGVVLTLSVWMWRGARARARLDIERAALARQELEKRVVERTQELSAANKRLRESFIERQQAEGRVMTLQEELFQANKLAILGQIVAGVAHEINQPLSAIRIQAENALEHLRRESPDRARLNLELIAQLIVRCASITGELLTFAKRNADIGEPVRISEVIEGALVLVGHRVRETGTEIQRSGSEDVVLHAPRVKLEQVLVNLLRNALDAVGERENARIELATSHDASGVRLTISDNGPGIPRARADMLFMPFQTTKASGLGLGLIISREIMRGLGGDLLHRQGDVGAVFEIILPPSALSPAAVDGASAK